MDSHHDVQVVPPDARRVLVRRAPPGTTAVSFSLVDLSDTEDLKPSRREF